jgi:hypothetical protein
MNFKRAFLSCTSMLVLLCIGTTVSADGIAPESAAVAVVEGALPTFADYPAKGKFKGKVAPAKIRTKEARTFRTRITEGAKEGPNFAGHYTITTWGCGSSCVGFAIVDANTGKVYMPPFYVSTGHRLGETLQNRDLIEYRLDSRLLIVTGSRNETDQGQYFYTWENNRLKLIRTEGEIRD